MERSRPRVGLDTAPFIYHIEQNPHHRARCARLFGSIESGEAEGVASVVSSLEVLVMPIKLGRPDLRSAYVRAFTSFPNLRVVPATLSVAWLAAELRAQYGLRTPDSIVAATILDERCNLFVTNDRHLKVLEERGVKVEILGRKPLPVTRETKS